VPDIPELEGLGRWACVPLDFTWRAHHSMIVDNVSDFTHAWLHRKYQPFTGAELTRCETVGDGVYVSYRTEGGRGRISRLFVQHRRQDQALVVFPSHRRAHHPHVLPLLLRVAANPVHAAAHPTLPDDPRAACSQPCPDRSAPAAGRTGGGGCADGVRSAPRATRR